MINACVIGLGQRGYSLLRDVLLKNTDINIVAVCDLYDDRIEQALNAVADAGQIAKGFTDYKEALAYGICTGSASAFSEELAEKKQVEDLIKKYLY